MTVHQAIAQLAHRTTPLPIEAIQCLRDNWEMAEPRLLLELDQTLANPSKPPSALFTYALFLCAEMRSKAAFERYIKICRLTTALINFLANDLMAEIFEDFLAASCHGRFEELQAVVEDESRDAFARATALDALRKLTADGDFARDNLKRYCLELLDFRLEPQPSFIWTAAICLAIELGLTEALPLIGDAYANKFINDRTLPFEDVARHLAHSDGFLVQHVGDLRGTTEEAILFYFSEWPESERITDETETSILAQMMKRVMHADQLKMLSLQGPAGRNDPCPCGSGQKYKKCCINKDDAVSWNPPVSANDADRLIYCGYCSQGSQADFGVFLCWNHAWRTIVDTEMIAENITDPADPACELFNCCTSFSEWIEDFLHLMIDAGILPIRFINQAMIAIQELIHKFPAMPEILRVKAEYALAVSLAKAGRSDEAETLFNQSLSRATESAAVYLLHGMRKSFNANKLNLHPDWEGALAYMEKAFQLADERVRQAAPLEEYIHEIKITIELRTIRAELAES